MDNDGLVWGWEQELWRRAEELESWIDETALRLGDILVGHQSSQVLFGPHADSA